jgi:MoxR-like ATPase
LTADSPPPEAPAPAVPLSIEALQSALAEASYLAERGLATSIFLALRLGRPLLLEGEAGVGKTEVAKALASALGRRLIRLQCYEGLDLANAAYEWDYGRQLLHIRLLEATGTAGAAGDGGESERARRELYSPEYLLRRPLLEAIDPAARSTPGPAGAPVLLIDELDRADEEFEAFLLEVLSDFQLTVPELGTFTAPTPPIVIVTSNRTRDLHDALRRRCLYRWVDYPALDRELAIVRARVPGAGEALSRQVVTFVQALRREELYKRPGVAETIDWAAGLAAMDRDALSPEAIEETLGLLLKYQDDILQVAGETAARALEEALAS